MFASFTKMHGAGNDFVVFDERAGPLGLTPARVAALADRRTGIGCDQFITLEPPPPGSDADVFMRIRNPDGGEAGACGNATRCIADLLDRQVPRGRHVIRTIAGDLAATVLPDGRWRVDMGAPGLGWEDIPLLHPADTLHLHLAANWARGLVRDPAAASMGNPHATFFVGDVAALPVERLGPVLEHAALFPQRANIGFAQVLAPDRIRLRVWERQAGLTRACGSAACATLVNAHRRGLTGRAAVVVMDGGDLDIAWREADGHVLMTGPVATTFRGQIDLSAFPP